MVAPGAYLRKLVLVVLSVDCGECADVVPFVTGVLWGGGGNERRGHSVLGCHETGENTHFQLNFE